MGFRGKGTPQDNREVRTSVLEHLTLLFEPSLTRSFLGFFVAKRIIGSIR